MGHESNYIVAQQHDDSFQIERTTEPLPRTARYVTPPFARTGQQAGLLAQPVGHHAGREEQNLANGA
jgi:hypothetical protein